MTTNLADHDAYLEFTIKELMFHICKSYKEQQQLTDDLLSSLYVLFPLHAVSALDLVDHQSVSLVCSPSGRRIYSCYGSSGTPYLVSYTGSFCTCPTYRRNLSRDHTWCCKHLLAVQLSIATSTLQHREVGEDIMISMMHDMLQED